MAPQATTGQPQWMGQDESPWGGGLRGVVEPGILLPCCWAFPQQVYGDLHGRRSAFGAPDHAGRPKTCVAWRRLNTQPTAG